MVLRGVGMPTPRFPEWLTIGQLLHPRSDRSPRILVDLLSNKEPVVVTYIEQRLAEVGVRVRVRNFHGVEIEAPLHDIVDNFSPEMAQETGPSLLGKDPGNPLMIPETCDTRQGHGIRGPVNIIVGVPVPRTTKIGDVLYANSQGIVCRYSVTDITLRYLFSDVAETVASLVQIDEPKRLPTWAQVGVRLASKNDGSSSSAIIVAIRNGMAYTRDIEAYDPSTTFLKAIVRQFTGDQLEQLFEPRAISTPEWLTPGAYIYHIKNVAQMFTVSWVDPYIDQMEVKDSTGRVTRHPVRNLATMWRRPPELPTWIQEGVLVRSSRRFEKLFRVEQVDREGYVLHLSPLCLDGTFTAPVRPFAALNSSGLLGWEPASGNGTQPSWLKLGRLLWRYRDRTIHQVVFTGSEGFETYDASFLSVPVENRTYLRHEYGDISEWVPVLSTMSALGRNCPVCGYLGERDFQNAQRYEVYKCRFEHSWSYIQGTDQVAPPTRFQRNSTETQNKF